MPDRPLVLLALNVGSSSLKAERWAWPGAAPEVAREVRGIGEEGGGAEDHREALALVLPDLLAGGEPAAAGHRIVHGGPRHRESRRLTEEVLADLEAAVPFSPLHMVPALAVIRRLAELRPGLPQVGVFDTAFHATIPEEAAVYAVPAAWRDRGLFRFGFHGLALASVVRTLGPDLAPRLVILHLGAGCSATAVLEGRSVDTTMGLTPLEGLVMATRAGDLDPGLILHLLREGMEPEALDRALNRESGLLGLSGRSGDMEILLEHPEDPACRRAVDVFCRRAAKAVGALAASLGGLDQLVFSGGIGEHAAEVRARIASRLAWLGVTLDEKANARHADLLSPPAARVRVHRIRVDEGREIAAGTAGVLGAA